MHTFSVEAASKQSSHHQQHRQQGGEEPRQGTNATYMSATTPPPSGHESPPGTEGEGAASSRRPRPRRLQQFRAVLRKNFLVQTRNRKSLCGIGGVAGLVLELSLPVLFFLLMLLAKHYLPVQPIPGSFHVGFDITTPYWSDPKSYHGPASALGKFANIAFAPDTPGVRNLTVGFAKAAACSGAATNGGSFEEDVTAGGLFDDELGDEVRDGLNATMRRSLLWDPDEELHADEGNKARPFSGYFPVPLLPECRGSRAGCIASERCWKQTLEQSVHVYADESAALDAITKNPPLVDALVVMDPVEMEKYTVRMNWTATPSTNAILDLLELTPSDRFKKYFFFANTQLAVDQALMGIRAAPDGPPTPIPLSVKVAPFPWPESKINLAAAAAGSVFTLLLVVSFLMPTRAMVVQIVHEAELRLREGMLILGLRDAAYWASWALTHYTQLLITGLLCTVTCTFIFVHTSSTVMFSFFALASASLVSFAYMLSTFFNTSRVAGGASALVFGVAMVPGFVIKVFYPYGHWSWTATCLAAPSAISMYADVLTKLELAEKGLTWRSSRWSITSASHFSAATILSMLALDTVIYALLALYLDRVLPRTYGQRWPFWFPLLPSTWSACLGRRRSPADADEPGMNAHQRPSAKAAVRIMGLRKEFGSPTGGTVVAVEGLNMDIPHGRITGLLGHNGAGKTTTISMLTGMIEPTSGTAIVNGLSLRHDMGRIRDSLGVCPQFDILWPTITVREHLELYAQIKGVPNAEAGGVAVDAATAVQLEEKLDDCAGDLSGGQRRKLSVAIAFLGSPALVFLDEPTSGMDPCSRRFTWGVIRGAASGCAVVLTTHSMEEADTLCDGIAIMADGALAANGSPGELKASHGVGYTLRVVQNSSFTSIADATRATGSYVDLITSLVERHVSSAQLASASGGELCFRLPKDQSASFPELLRELQSEATALNIRTYGLSITTLEEVFIAIADKRTPSSLLTQSADAAGTSGQPSAPLAAPSPSGTTVGSWGTQFLALVRKRALSSRRDRLAVLTQLAVPLALVLVALWAGSATRTASEPPLRLDTPTALDGERIVWGALPTLRGAGGPAEALAGMHATRHWVDSSTTSLAASIWRAPEPGSMQKWLLDQWFGADRAYGAVFMERLPVRGAKAQVFDQPMEYTLLVNQTAFHALPATMAEVNSAVLRWVTDDPGAANFEVHNHPLPLVETEARQRMEEFAASLLLLLFAIMSLALLTSSFVVFVVRERSSGSKQVQMVSGASPSAFWASTYVWDIANYAIPCFAILVCFASDSMPQFRGPRWVALAILLFAYGIASLPLTYALHFLFEDEFKALQFVNNAYWISGYLGFILTYILDIIWIVSFKTKTGVHAWERGLNWWLRAVSPHYCVAKGMYDIGASYKDPMSLVPGMGGDPGAKSPFTQETLWVYIECLACQAVGYSLLTMVIELDYLPWLQRQAMRVLRRLAAGRAVGYAALDGDLAGTADDEDVAREQRDLAGSDAARRYQLAVQGLHKTYQQGLLAPPVPAVRGVSLGVNPGECFGLLGTNGAGKTSTFKMLTGELLPDAGDAYVATHSISRARGAARRRIGYAPQMHGLPDALTGRETLALYARLRGCPSAGAGAAADELLGRLGLGDAADRLCGTYSGGNRRKLSVAVALVGGPPVLLLDEPSTGMDPKARQFLREFLQAQVLAAGQTVVLTSHSMEECEALCTRLAIMVAGQFRCMGSVQHLKNVHGTGYTLELRAASDMSPERLQQFPRTVTTLIRAARLMAADGHRMVFALCQEDVDLPSVFETVEAHRVDIGIEEYSLSQTTLEQVFVALARAADEDVVIGDAAV